MSQTAHQAASSSGQGYASRCNVRPNAVPSHTYCNNVYASLSLLSLCLQWLPVGSPGLTRCLQSFNTGHKGTVVVVVEVVVVTLFCSKAVVTVPLSCLDDAPTKPFKTQNETLQICFMVAS